MYIVHPCLNLSKICLVLITEISISSLKFLSVLQVVTLSPIQIYIHLTKATQNQYKR